MNSQMVIVAFFFLIVSASVIGIPSTATNATIQDPTSAAPKRQMGIGTPKHIPIKMEVRNITNEKWAHDLEVEVTNKSDKPIYYLSFHIIPQKVLPFEDEKFAFWIHYGRAKLNNFSTPIEATDVPLLPNESCVLKIGEPIADGWEKYREVHNKPQPEKVGLVFQALNFGDGTGYQNAQGSPVNIHKKR